MNNTPKPKCSCCKTYFELETKSSGLFYKTCLPCRVRDKKKCPHLKVKKDCKECNPCPHFKLKQNCKECNLCPHFKLKQGCKECNLCPHNRRRDVCAECNPCPHQKLKSACKECNPCPHLRRKDACIECNGCPHFKLKKDCRECNDALKLTIQRFISNSKKTDKLNNMFDIVNFIDRDFCHLLIQESNNKCCYCDCELQLIHFGANLMSIERVDNSIGHIKSNVKIACLKCNTTRIGSKLEQIEQTELTELI